MEGAFQRQKLSKPENSFGVSHSYFLLKTSLETGFWYHPERLVTAVPSHNAVQFYNSCFQCLCFASVALRKEWT